MSEEVVRLPNGFPVSVRERDEFDARAARNLEAAMAYFKKFNQLPPRAGMTSVVPLTASNHPAMPAALKEAIELERCAAALSTTSTACCHPAMPAALTETVELGCCAAALSVTCCHAALKEAIELECPAAAPSTATAAASVS